jgi:hypothetical protein
MKKAPDLVGGLLHTAEVAPCHLRKQITLQQTPWLFERLYFPKA